MSGYSFPHSELILFFFNLPFIWKYGNAKMLRKQLVE